MSDKHFQLVVPNYTTTGAADGAPLSYIRLGASWGSNETLASGLRGDELITPSVSGSGGATYYFKDDQRAAETRQKSKTYYEAIYYNSGGTAQDTIKGTTDPSVITGKLMTAGGVREHTDGNRISTTRGDCVEVVGGNYKLHIMGRVEGSNVGRSYWESSGGHNHDSTSTPGEVTTITWAPGVEGDTWEVLEETIKGEVHATFKGRQEEIFYGPTLKSTTGATTPPAMKERVYAQSVEEDTYATSITEHTRVTGNMTEKMDVDGKHEDITEVDANVTMTSTKAKHDGSGNLNSSPVAKGDYVPTFKSRLHAGIVASATEFNTHFKDGYGGDLTVVVEFGATVGVSFATHRDLKQNCFLFPITIADQLDISIAAKANCEIGVWLAFNCLYKEEVGLGPTIKVTLANIGAAIVRKKISAVEAAAKLATTETRASANQT